MREFIDVSRVKQEFNWKPKNDLSRGLEKTIDWIKQENERQPVSKREVPMELHPQRINEFDWSKVAKPSTYKC